MSAEDAYRPCPACGSANAVPLPALAPPPWRIGRCASCDFVFLLNPVDYSALEQEYAWERTYVAEDVAREAARGPVRRLARRARVLGYKLRGQRAFRYLSLLEPGPTLEIGCADAVRVTPPFTPYGIELSKALATRADEKMRALGGYCLQGAGAERIRDFPDGFFTGVLMHSYLEHEVRFAEVLAQTFRVLAPGGRAFIRVPNFSSVGRRLHGARWPGFRHPDHVNYFTPGTLRRAVEHAGFRYKLVNRHKIWLDDNIQALAIKPAA
ncbi:MAG: methyltransferase domain-containing protein [Alphaproteobacteria bacterium]|nr:MAG: methyltransferase domain-containing protein [Alphaproteobacteria bacterium]